METAPNPQPTRRKRGAQPGNRNAYKHGFYAKSFSAQELKSLQDVQNGMTDEIAMLRLLMRRILEQADEPESKVEVWTQTLQRLSLVSNRLAKLLKTHHELSGEEDNEIEAVKKEFNMMLGEKGWNQPEK